MSDAFLSDRFDFDNLGGWTWYSTAWSAAHDELHVIQVMDGHNIPVSIIFR